MIVCAGRDTAALAGDLPVRVSTHTRFAYPVREPAPLACLQDGWVGAYGDPLPGNERYAVGLGDERPGGRTSPSDCRGWSRGPSRRGRAG